ncbi:MAG: CoA ester lyase [Alphaproteobacteria bacterium]|nr:CoA ester lyase [Alphaproteobacteria bacterium]
MRTFQFSCCRSVLFVPANRPDRFQKALDSGADAIVIDLEDAVSLNDKDTARKIVVDYFNQNNFQNSKVGVFLRMNSIKTLAGLKDAQTIIENKITPDALLIPKTETAGEIDVLNNLFFYNPLPLILLIETAKGLHEIYNITKASNNIKALVFGGADFSADIGAILSWEEMLFTRSLIVSAAANAGIPAYDVPYLGLKDADNGPLDNEIQHVKNLGFSAKFAIHPKQVPSINKIFTPSPEEVAEAQNLLDQMEKSHGNVFEFNGKMVDYPVIKKAQKTMAIYNATLQKP